jgi:hypothetical protein
MNIYLLDGHQKIYCFHWSVLSPGSTLWCGPMSPNSWNEWDSHSIYRYLLDDHQKMPELFPLVSLVPWVNLMVWAHGPWGQPYGAVWGHGPLDPTSEMSEIPTLYIFTWWSSKDELLPLVSLVPWVNLPLKCLRFLPYKYIFDGHQKIIVSTRRLVPWVNLVVFVAWPPGSYPGSYIPLKWDSHSINRYLLDDHQKMNFFHSSVLSPGSTSWCGLMAPWVLPLKWVRFPPYKYIFDGHQKINCFHWSVLSWNMKLCQYICTPRSDDLRPNFGPIWYLALPPGGQNRKHKKCYDSWTNGWIISKSLSYVLFKFTEVKVQNGTFIVGTFRYFFN